MADTPDLNMLVDDARVAPVIVNPIEQVGQLTASLQRLHGRAELLYREAAGLERDNQRLADLADQQAAELTRLRAQLAEGIELVKEGQAIVAQGQHLLAEADQRAELLRRQVAELEAERDQLADDLALAVLRRDGAHTELTRVRAEHAAEIGRLRALLTEALNEWRAAHTAAIGYSHAAPPDRMAEIIQEAGLT